MTAIDDVNASSVVVHVDAGIAFRMETTKYTHILKHLMININSPFFFLFHWHYSPLWTMACRTRSFTQYFTAFEDGTDRGFRNVGKLQSDAGEIPKRTNTRSFHFFLSPTLSIIVKSIQIFPLFDFRNNKFFTVWGC
jgi:hypothetical protein